MRDFLDYVRSVSELWREASRLPHGEWMRERPVTLASDAPVALVVSPHPDDEAIIGGLPLRLLRQSGMRVVNLAVTLGSDKERRAARLDELRGSCEYLGFDLEIAGAGTLEDIKLETRRDHPRKWLSAVDPVAESIGRYQPWVIFLPHSTEAHPTHIGTHSLTRHALIRLGESFSCYCVETEFWSPIDRPNLMVEVSEEDLADLIAGLSFHRGEIRRNPYHLGLPAWMMDNVRRGSELIAGKGAASHPFLYATLYRLVRWSEGKYREVAPLQPFLSAQDDPAELFPPPPPPA